MQKITKKIFKQAYKKLLLSIFNIRVSSFVKISISDSQRESEIISTSLRAVIGIITAGLIFLSFTASSSWAKTQIEVPHSRDTLHKIAMPEHVKFNAENSYTCIKLARALELYHYSKKKLDDAMSSKILARYIDMLDPSKHLFTQKDMDEFDRLKFTLDDSLKSGDLRAGYKIFNLFLMRSFDRLIYIKGLLNKWQTKFNFNKDDNIYIDRENKPWPGTKKDLMSLWRRELKNSILALKLDKKTDKKITKDLEKRYKSRLNRLCRTNSADAFRTYMNAMAMSFDPHTTYFPPKDSEDFDIQMSLSLEGIGAVLQSKFENTKIVSLVPGGPAEKSGQLMPGDKIIGVGQNASGPIQDVVGWRIDDVVRLIRGHKGTLVRLQIIPADKKGIENAKIVSIKRDKIKLEDQAAHKKIVTITKNGKPYSKNSHNYKKKLQTYKIGIIDLPAFYLDFQALQAGKKNYRSTTRDVKALIKELEDKKIDGLIIDLRDNGGGSLEEANKLAGLFIEAGPTVQIRMRNGKIISLNDPDPTIFYNGPLIVMINRMSASASEIFAGAIKDYNRGIIVGSKSFGKGTVQSLEPLSRGKLKITTAKFYRVSGKSTQDLGVLPDIKFPPVYNSKEIGESSLKGSLKWDQIRPSFYYVPYKTLTPVIKDIRHDYYKWKIKDPGIKYLTEKYKLSSQIYKIKSWSLNEKIREQQKDRIEKMELKIDNNFLKSKGLAPVKTIKAFNDKITDKKQYRDKRKSGIKNKKNKSDEKEDILMDETQRVMAEFISLTREKNYNW